MKFVDEANILVVAGNGGNGCISFSKNKDVQCRKPNGGDGGDGGNILLLADRNLNTLIECKLNKIFYAEHGRNGSSNYRSGSSGKDTVIKLPVGTIVIDQFTKKILVDIIYNGQKTLIAKGGVHGLGNYRFRSYKNQLKNKNQIKGSIGEIKKLYLKLVLLADVGMLGLPNAGKSTFINSITSAKSKVASYPFTTLWPVLGSVSIKKNKKFVIADIPGLIKQSSSGAGLGIKFLKHLERCNILLHLIDLSPIDGSNPIDNAKIIFDELKSYNNKLSDKPCWIVFNKIDLLDYSVARSLSRKIIKLLNWKDKYYLISSKKRYGIKSLCNDLVKFIYKYY